MYCTMLRYTWKKDPISSVNSVLFICRDQAKEQGVSIVGTLLDSWVYTKDEGRE